MAITGVLKIKMKTKIWNSTLKMFWRNRLLIRKLEFRVLKSKLGRSDQFASAKNI